MKEEVIISWRGFMNKVLFHQDGYIATVTINRPNELNCFDLETLEQFAEIVDRIHADRSIRSVIFTGAGEKSFSTGADLKERRTLNEQQVRRNVSKIREVFNKVEELPQPTIAAINGFAFGGGLELALACDFRYAADTASMGLTEVAWAIIPGAGGTQRLPRLIGKARAKELILTGRKFGAAFANDWGIVNGVSTKGELLPTCHRLAEEICRNGPLAVVQAKYAVNYGSEVDLKTGMAIESKAYEVIIPTKDRVEALQAFSERRKPEFRGE
jgi:enoyl-CoA hydratase